MLYVNHCYFILITVFSFQEFSHNGTITKTKERRLFLTNDLIICVSVVPKSNDDFSQHSERLSLKWAHPVTDVEVCLIKRCTIDSSLTCQGATACKVESVSC